MSRPYRGPLLLPLDRPPNARRRRTDKPGRQRAMTPWHRSIKRTRQRERGWAGALAADVAARAETGL